MLTETDMIRIMAAKFNLTDSLNQENNTTETDEETNLDNTLETISFEISDIKDYAIQN